jgi:ATP-dependent exoDNAse (exonuclease V) beta subunit
MIYTYSKLSDFEKCPRFYEAAYLLKTVQRTTTPALAKGRTIHKLLENAVRNRDLTPPEGLRIDPKTWGGLVRVGAKPEVKIAVDKNFEACDFDDANVHLRGVIDVLVRKPTGILCVDWKSGKPGYTDVLQAKVYAAMLHAALGVNVITFAWNYVCFGVVELAKLEGERAVEDVKELIDRVENTRGFPPKPSFFCRFCGNVACQFYSSVFRHSKDDL